MEDRNKKLQQKLDEVLKIFEIPKQKKSRFEDESSDDESNDYESFDDDSIDETSESSRASTPLKNIKRDKPVTRSGNLDSENEQFVNTNIEIKEENINETVPFDPFDPLSSSTSHHQLI